MKALRPFISAVLALLCVLPAYGAEPQLAMPPALLEAIAGNEPYASLVEYGLPLLTTAEEVAELPEALRSSRAVAIKRVLMEQMIQARADRHRITAENYAHSAQRAQELGAPAVFVLYQKLLAEDELSARECYIVRSALNKLYENYGINYLALRFFVEGAELSTEVALEIAGWIPLEGLFNHIREEDLTLPLLENQLHELAAVNAELVRVFSGIQSAEQAEAALPELLPLLVRFESTAGLRKYATPQQFQVLNFRHGTLIRSIGSALPAERIRLREADYYGNERLRVLNMLLN